MTRSLLLIVIFAGSVFGASYTSSFPGTENPLSESGSWSAPGSWANLEESSGTGVFPATAGTTAAARLVSPSIGPIQYSEITYDTDPGASNWVGIMTRIQGSGNGSGYLVIAFDGEILLYRADDTGSLAFTPLGTVTAVLSTSPRDLRLESSGSTHNVYFNGALVMTRTDATYTTGQPGIVSFYASSVTAKITSFSGGDISNPGSSIGGGISLSGGARIQ